MIKEKQHPKRNPKWTCNSHPLRIQLPKLHEPLPPVRSLECTVHGQRSRVCSVEAAPVRHRRARDQRNGHPVVSEEPAYMAMEEGRLTERLEEEGSYEHEERADYTHQRAFAFARGVGELTSYNLDAVLQVNP